MIAEWDVAFELSTPEGTLEINQTDPVTKRRYQLVPSRCTTGLPVRVTEDDMPQHDGKIPHRRWRSGYQVHLAIEPLIEVAGELQCAGGADLVVMTDTLGLHFNSMIRTGLFPGSPNARLIFDPTGASDRRMFDRLQLQSAPASSLDGSLGGLLVEVDLDTPFPYYISYTELDTPLTDTGIEIITNGGNTDYYPVIEVYGTTPAFTITNESIVDFDGNPLTIVYDETLPGGQVITTPDSVEIITFQGTCFLNQDEANRKAGIDMRVNDFFPLIPGDNEVWITGATALVKSNSAWA